MEFKSTILWEQGHKLFKLYPKKSKKGETYFMGELNKMNKITMWKRKGYQDNPDYYEVSLIPVKFEKQEEKQTPVQKVKDTFDGFEEPEDDVAF